MENDWLQEAHDGCDDRQRAGQLVFCVIMLLRVTFDLHFQYHKYTRDLSTLFPLALTLNLFFNIFQREAGTSVKMNGL